MKENVKTWSDLGEKFGDRPPRRWKKKKRSRRRSGLRARLTRMFALVAVLAVVVTTFGTVDAAFQVINQLNPELNLGSFRDGGWNTEPSGTLTAQQTLARDAGRQIMGSAVRSALFSALLAVIIAGLVTRQLTRPLSRLVDGAGRLQAGARDVQLPLPRRHDELRELTGAFNELTLGLARQEAWRRGLMADIAHDLRTPLAVLRSEIEAMQDGVQPTDTAALGRLHGEVLLLARLVTDLRLLSLAESGAINLSPIVLDGGEVLRALADAHALRAAEVGVTLSVSAPAPVPLTADPDRLRQTLQNMLDNALRYAAPGEVMLSAHSDASGVTLSVRDHGPGFQNDDLSRAFERFYRADASRTRDPGGRASSGLGLAIARALTEAQGGTVTARNHPGGGAEFVLTFPNRAGETT
ncbi:ATP-binding protein [Deinococcus frigens]|uniref:ATP-binding protein n=1 Tax=Deinococcus frigens TaxID=249403 RepID=UPI000A05927A|nr:ATP-binding protein [Deinococcus frigens]